MKNLNSDIRLTDALERQLLAQAIESQQAYALNRAVQQFFQKIISFLKAPKTSMHHNVSTAH